MIFIFGLLIMWAMATVFLFMSSKEKTNFWFSGVLFVQGLGMIEAFIEFRLIPDALEYVRILWIIRWLLAALCFRLFPYFLLMAGISYFEFSNFKWKRQLSYLVFAPVLISFIFDLIFIQDGFLNTDLPKSKIYWITYLWSVPYYLFSNYLFLIAYLKESNIQKRKHRLLLFIALSLPTMAIMIMTVTISPHKDWWKYFLTQSFCLAGIFLFFIGKYGLEGLKIRFEKEYESGTISGVTIISHTIKNELSKIHCNIDFIRRGIGNPQKSIDNIDIATDHMYKIIDRVDKHIQGFELQYDNYNLSEIIDSLLISLEPVFRERNIQIIKNYQSNPVVCCDKVHLTEVLNNILINAIEAVEGMHGIIAVELNVIKKQAIIKISDNGLGIPKDQLSNVSNLFYSTKGSNAKIRGTGLYYCTTVIKRHRGEFQISSEPGIGTTVTIKIPA
jgi:two-component sensor histidine kinase